MPIEVFYPIFTTSKIRHFRHILALCTSGSVLKTIIKYHRMSIRTSVNKAENGVPEPQYNADSTFTDSVINACGPKTNPRLRQLMASLIRHIHDFARENGLTVDEWMKGIEMVNWAGQMSNDQRNEGQLLCDVIGLES